MLLFGAVSYQFKALTLLQEVQQQHLCEACWNRALTLAGAWFYVQLFKFLIRLFMWLPMMAAHDYLLILKKAGKGQPLTASDSKHKHR